jgi:hypothetical protein
MSVHGMDVPLDSAFESLDVACYVFTGSAMGPKDSERLVYSL